MAKNGGHQGHFSEKRWIAYTVAAGAALSMAGTSEAGVIYSGEKSIKVNATNPMVSLDINGDATDDFTVIYRSIFASYNLGTFKTFYQSKGIVIAGASSGNSVVGDRPNFFYFAPYRLSGVNEVSASMPGSWSSTQGILNGVKYLSGSTYTRGNFVGSRGFIGVRFNIGSNTHYGWIEYEGSDVVLDGSQEGVGRLENGLPVVEGTILGWAYEDVPERKINAGDKGVPSQPVPTLNEWGMIFLMGLILAEGARRLRKLSA